MDPLADLLLAFRSRGDVRALGDLFDRTAPRLLRLAMHLVSHAADAEDLVQQTFVLAMQKAVSFDERQPLMPWLCGILAGEARNLVRKRRRNQAGALPELGTDDREPPVAAEHAELVAQLRAHVEELPGEQRQVLLMQLQHGLSPTEIAEILDVPPGTVRMRLHRGLAALRRLLPTATAALLVGLLPNRGMAAVRQAVLGEASGLAAVAFPVGSVASVTLLAMTMKYWLTFGCAIVLLGLWWWLEPSPPPPPVPRAVDGPVAAQTSTVEPVDRAAVGAAMPKAAGEQRQLLVGPTGGLRVRVLFDRDRQPVVGVAVQIDERAEPGAPSLRTDADGEVRFEAVSPGTPRLRVGSAARPLPTFVAELPTVTAGGEVTAVLLLPAAGNVEGLVTDEHGLPLAEAEVWVGEDRDDPELQRRVALTDAEGRFSVVFSHHEHVVTVHKGGYCCSSAQPTFEEAGSSVRHFVLRRRGGRVEGTVRTAAGSPVVGCVVSLRTADHLDGRADDGSLRRRPPPRHATAAADGRFVFADVAPGAYRLRAMSVAGIGTPVAVTAGVAVPVEVVLPASVLLRGTVRGADGLPVAGARVHAEFDPGAFDPSPLQVAARSGADGSYELPIAPGAYLLFARSETAGSCRQTVQVTAQAESTCDLRLDGATELAGVVVDDGGQPLRSWNVALRRGTQQSAWSLTNALGEFRFPALTGAADELVVWPPLGEAAAPALVAAIDRTASPQRLVVPAQLMPSAQVRGRVVGRDGKPAGATVTLKHGDHDGPSLRCCAEGRFVFGALPPGSFVLVVEATDQATMRVPVAIAVPAQELDLGALTPPPAGRMEVTVTQKNGQPWRGPLPWLSLEPVDDDEIAPAHVRFTGAVGLSDPVPAGRYRLRCQEPDLTLSAADEHEITAFTTTRVTLAVGIGRTLNLQFTPPEEVPFVAAERLHAQVLDASGAVVHQRVLRRAPISKPRQYDYYVTLPTGSYRVQAHTDAGLRFAMELQVAAEPMRRVIEVPLVAR
jgi:RNA polymerase sigma-70 factor (ECF subfamily)